MLLEHGAKEKILPVLKVFEHLHSNEKHTVSYGGGEG